MRNRDVAQAWRDGRSARSQHMSTDGKDVYSYRLRIGTTVGTQKISFMYRAGGQMHSQTTSHHQYLVQEQVSTVMAALTFEKWAQYWGVT